MLILLSVVVFQALLATHAGRLASPAAQAQHIALERPVDAAPLAAGHGPDGNAISHTRVSGRGHPTKKTTNIPIIS